MSQIESDALDSSVALADALRKCVALGGRSGSSELRDWARQQLDGYGPDDDLPAYRRVSAIIAIDGATMSAVIKQQRIAHSSLPDFAQQHIREEVELPQGVGQLEHMVRSSGGEAIKITLPAMGDLASYMNDHAPYGTSISGMYWVVAANTVVGLLDRIRTDLVSLVAEMRAVEPAADVPSAAAASQAVHVVVNGGKRNKIEISPAMASGSGDATTASPASKSHVPAWVRGPWGALVGLSSIVGGFAGFAAWQHWPPF